ncbi:unnamed protein product [Orchesella dallaii]|uniref:Peptidase C1A papain C-terminal domain-containing protein n=1 Tax=Orchesella dallaii TaxID=48710 RepID=A0ABP1QPN7_9HEXA
MFSTNRVYACKTLDYPPGCDGSDINEWVKEAKKYGIHQNYDLRKVWGSKCPSVLEISDQGSCNTCWAVAVTAVLTDRLCIFTDGETKERYSAADVMTCCDPCSSKDTTNICAKQGKHRQVWLRWINEGITSGGFYKDESGCLPYPIPPCNHNLTSDTSSLKSCSSGLFTYSNTCSNDCDGESPSVKKLLLKGKRCYLLRRDSLYRTVKGEDSIKMEIFKRGPVHAVINANLTLYVPGTIYNSRETDRPHSVRIVGWGEEQGTKGDIQKYWIVANLWGKEWGMDGFFNLTFNYIGHPEVIAGQFEESETC